jgi:hypothetical protein
VSTACSFYGVAGSGETQAPAIARALEAIALQFNRVEPEILDTVEILDKGWPYDLLRFGL